jgi:PAS domain S-box-containing protein
VVEAFDGFLYICSQDYRMEFMNQRLIERTGRNAVGETCYKALHDTDSICEWCVNDKVFQGETVRWEVQSPKDHRWYYVVNTPIRHADGTLSKQSMITDITERKQAEEALQKSEERILALVENTSDMIWSVDAKTFGLLTFNGALRNYFSRGHGLEIHVGMTPDQMLPKEYAAQWREFYARALREGPFVTEYLTSAKSHVLLLSINCLKIRGEVFGISVFGRDITERKQAEEILKANDAALRNSKKDLQRLAGRLISAQEEELRRLSRELHDDLTQRLAVLAIEAGKLELDLNKMPEKYPEAVDSIAQIKDQLIKVSEDVHTISRQLHPTILDDLGLVRALESECSAVMRRHPVKITFRNENVPDAISDDIALCLYRVVQEGLRNIATHSGSKNCEIFLKSDDHALCLTVSDDGIGFDPLEVRKMPGLGLSSMRERVQLIQGDFTIRSQPGKGAVITVCVPLAGGVG